MPASYPSSVVGFATHNSGDRIASADINGIQAEIVALETALLSSGLSHLVQTNGLRTQSPTMLTIASGVVAALLFHHKVDTEGGAGTDQLDTINLGAVSEGISLGIGSLLLLTPANVSHVVTVSSGTGNITLIGAGSYVMSDAASALLLRYDGTNWIEIARSQTASATGSAQTYTPAWTASVSNPALGNGSVTGKYVQIGKFVHYEIVYVFGSTTTFGSGTYKFSLPVAAASGGDSAAGHAVMFEAGVEWRIGVAIIADANNVSIIEDHDTGSGITPTTPFTFASGQVLSVSGCYIAS